MLTNKKRVTMREIAEKIGVSHATVSLALGGHPRISEELRKKIRGLAAEMGYAPDPRLTVLSHYRHNHKQSSVRAAIAWLNCWSNPKELRDSREYDRLWQGASLAAKKFGYRLEEFRVGKDMPLARLEQVLTTRDIKGILIPPHRETPNLDGFNWDQFSVVRLGRTVPTPKMHVVSSDQTTNAMLAFQNIREKGYERIAYIGGSGPYQFYTAGFLHSQLGLSPGMRLPPLLLAPGAVENQAQISVWIKRWKPQAILTDLGDLPGIMTKLGRRVSQNIALVGLSMLDGNISACIDQYAEEIGRVAVLVVISQLNDFAQGVPTIFRQILVEGSWVDGPSCPFLKKKVSKVRASVS